MHSRAGPSQAGSGQANAAEPAVLTVPRNAFCLVCCWKLAGWAVVFFLSGIGAHALAHDGVHAGQSTVDHVLTTALDLGSFAAISLPLTYLLWRLVGARKWLGAACAVIGGLGAMAGAAMLYLHIFAGANLVDPARSIALASTAFGSAQLIAWWRVTSRAAHTSERHS
ncbi:MAG: hypothetical protein AAGF32_05590 [Pseudomonadota bacterium]